MRGCKPVTKTGFSLLEVILALAILAVSFAALGEVIRLADRNAALSREETLAQIIAESIMDELACGYRSLAAVNRAVYDDPAADPPWLYSIALENTPFSELLGVRILVEQQLPPQQQPAKFELLRWIADPDYMASEQDAEDAKAADSSSSTSSTSSGGGSSSGGSSSSSSGSGP